LPPKPFTPPKLPVSYSKPSPVDFTTSQAAAMAASAPAPAPVVLPSAKTLPSGDVVHEKYDDHYTICYDEPGAIPETDFQATVDSIVLSGDAHSVLTRLQSGTLRTDRREVTPFETALMNRNRYRREQNHYDAIGSSQSGNEVGPTSPFTKQEGSK